jgi:hypothetical protein
VPARRIQITNRHCQAGEKKQRVQRNENPAENMSLFACSVIRAADLQRQGKVRENRASPTLIQIGGLRSLREEQGVCRAESDWRQVQSQP